MRARPSHRKRARRSASGDFSVRSSAWASGATLKACEAVRTRRDSVSMAASGWRPAARSTSSAMTLPEPSQMALSGASR